MLKQDMRKGQAVDSLFKVKNDKQNYCPNHRKWNISSKLNKKLSECFPNRMYSRLVTVIFHGMQGITVKKRGCLRLKIEKVRI